MTNLFAEQPVHRPKLELFVIRRGRFFSSYSNFIILDDRSRIVRHSLYSDELLNAYQAANKIGQSVDCQRVFIVRDMSSARNYCHWVCDWMPRILLLRKLFVGRLLIAFNEELSDFQKQFLEMIEEVDVLDCQNKIVVAEELVYLSTTLSFCHPANYGDPHQLGLLNELGAKLPEAVSTSQPESIFIPRVRAGRRMLEQETEFIALLGERGIHTIYPEEMSASEQIKSFSAAKK